ncbi:class I SAM-dependent DNA methyltransferase [Anatilimnocola sp. NA78]|uniref:class I SAM-dependent DNA methyltransferase n=1 Tax=Anatilimnocola sp. NA78 TaxID=3415683 RepID=UPI003CE55046
MIATPLDEFITRWQSSAAAERANYALFLTQLCDLLGVPQPEPTRAEVASNAYVFERDVTFDLGDGTTSIGRIDLYKRGCFVLEAKQGSDVMRAEEEAARALLPAGTKTAKKKGTAVRGTKAWDDAMVRARGQAEAYAKALPTSEGWPPFLIVVDVGHSIELYSEFTRSGKAYVQFPDPQSFRIKLEDLRDEKIRTRLAAVWTDPLSLDPSRRAAKVTRELAERLAALAKLLEKAGHDPGAVAKFLMRCLFTMFAEDVELIPKGSFSELLVSLQEVPENFQAVVEALWHTMNTGGVSPVLRKKILKFNGGLFAESTALPLDRPMLTLLIEAAKSDWADVEPAIFGTLLERALDQRERHKLGAHYTPRAYVERLVMPTVIEPLRDEWKTAYAAAITHAQAGELNEAQAEVRAFHERLCETRVLDPACGSGNFLYVTLEHMKRLEGEVLNALREFGDKQQVLDIHEVDPHQFLGIELNPRAAAIADLVLWIGYLQWHFRTRGKAQPAEPIIRNYKNIECRDAVLAWDRTEPLLDEQGQPVTRWDGHTTKPHPVTGEEVPDENARVPVMKYINPKKAEWPPADFIVGNPPYIGVRVLRQTIGREYVDAIAIGYPEVPETADYVCYWWHRAALLVEHATLHRFGLITTDSITQQYSRPAIDQHLDANPGVQIVFAIDEHPWVEDKNGAAVQVAMTVAIAKSVASPSKVIGKIVKGGSDLATDVTFQFVSKISSMLRSDFDLAAVKPLLANSSICFQGIIPGNDGFKLEVEELKSLGIDSKKLPSVVRRYIIGNDIVRVLRQKWVIDSFGRSEEELRSEFPALYQWILDRVKPERDQNPRETRRKNWWLFAENAPKLRRAVNRLPRYITTPNTAKHRPFVFVDGDILPDAMAYAVATPSAFIHGVLSSRIHVEWSRAAGGTLEDRPRYNSKVTFSPFPFPISDLTTSESIGSLAEQLDAHRKRQQQLHPKLTLTDMYNVLEKLRSGEALSAKDKTIHDQGLVSVLRQIHDDLDAAVFAAYGWPADLTDEQILERLVALNAERAAEEARGLVRWLRPEFQAPQAAAGGKQAELDLVDDEPAETKPKKGAKQGTAKTMSAKPTKTVKLAWPKEQGLRTKAVQEALATATSPLTPAEIAKQFTRGNADHVAEILTALSSLGLVRKSRGKYSK